MKATVFKVNAFTADGNGGNPGGVVLNADNLSDEQMLSIAMKIGFSETAFLCQSQKADYKVRFFTTTEEVDLCGHATIASWSLLAQHNQISNGRYTQETRAGLLDIEVMEDFIYMQQSPSEFGELVPIPELAPLLGIGEDSFVSNLKPQIVSTGLSDLIVIIKNEDIINTFTPDLGKIKDFSRKHKITGFHIAVILEDTDSSYAVARNFAPLVGIDEESATGTSNGALLCYLKDKNVLSEQKEYRIEQGKAMNLKSYIFGKFINDDIWIGGNATIFDQITIVV